MGIMHTVYLLKPHVGVFPDQSGMLIYNVKLLFVLLKSSVRRISTLTI